MGGHTAQRKMLLFCVKTIVKDSLHFELVGLKKMRQNIHCMSMLSLCTLYIYIYIYMYIYYTCWQAH